MKILNKTKIDWRDTTFCSTDKHQDYIEMLKTEATCKPSSLRSQYPEINPDLIDILDKMLQFNPYFRPTTKELIQHPIFDKIRTSKEVSASNSVVIDVDENELQQKYGDEILSEGEKEKITIRMKISIVKDFIKFNTVQGSYNIRFLHGKLKV